MKTARSFTSKTVYSYQPVKIMPGPLRRGLTMALAGLTIACALLPASASTVYVSPRGKDTQAGSREAPLATVSQAAARIDKTGQNGEIVLLDGRYTQSTRLSNPVDAAGKPLRGEAVPSLLIRAEAGSKPFFDGSRAIEDARPLADTPGVYTVRGNFNELRPPEMWEQGTRTRYRSAANMEAVKKFPATVFVLDKNQLAFHTSDDRPPAPLNARIHVNPHGILVARDNVTIRGLRFENYLGRKSASGIRLEAANGRIEDCTAFNASRGFLVGYGASKSTITGSRATDVGTGIHIYGEETLVEDCYLERIRDNFMLETYVQDDSGIQVYAPGRHCTARRNTIIGFNGRGMMVKSNRPGSALFEYNTIVAGDRRGEPSGGMLYYGDWNPQVVYRRNIIAGYRIPLIGPAGVAGGGVFDENLIWSPRYREQTRQALETVQRQKTAQQPGTGSHNLSADPLFANPAAGDYRVLPGSPAMGPGDKVIVAGALPPAPALETGKQRPVLWVEAQAPLQDVAAWGRQQFRADPWRATTPDEGQDERATVALHHPNPSRFYATDHPGFRLRLEVPGAETMRQMESRIGDAAPAIVPFDTTLALTLPDRDGIYPVTVRVSNKQNQWSEPVTVQIALWTSPPRLHGAPAFITNRHGAAIAFETDRPALAQAQVRPAGDPAPPTGEPRPQRATTYDLEVGGEWTQEWFEPLKSHLLPLSLPELQPGKTYRCWLTLRTPVGGPVTVDAGTFQLQGEPRTLFVAAQNGSDTPDGGNRSRPFATLQYALDRALPGDTVHLLPGIYAEPAMLNHGGGKDAPLTIEAARPDTVFLDSQKRHDTLLRLENAPHVVIRNLNFQWFRQSGLAATDSPYLTVERCRFLNSYWSEWVDGTGIALNTSPYAVIRYNTTARLENGILLRLSPHSQILNNSSTQTMYGGLRLIYSDEGSTVQNNAFCFTGNNMLVIDTKSDTLAADCRLDYNNYATDFRPTGTPEKDRAHITHSIEPALSYLKNEAKSLIRWNSKPYYNLAQWRLAGGKDANSLFADPLWIDPLHNQWGVLPGSPNLNGGRDGGLIGAQGLAPSNPVTGGLK